MLGGSQPGPFGRMILSRTNRRACSIVRAVAPGLDCRVYPAGCAFCMSWLASRPAGCPGFRPGAIVVGVSRSVAGGRVLPRIAESVAAVAGDAPRRATVFAVAVVGLLLIVKVASAAQTGEAGQVVWGVALFVLPLLYAFPAPRRLLDRHRWPVPAGPPRR